MQHGGNLDKVEREYGIARKKILDFSTNINPFIKPHTLRRIINTGMHRIIHYPDPEYFNLTKAIAENTGIDHRYLIPGNGSIELIFLYARVLKPAHALVVTPAFTEYEQALALTGASLSYFRLEADADFNLDPGKLMAELDTGYDLLALGNPNNPTSTFTDPGKLEAIIRHADKRGIKVLLDEAFIDFTGVPVQTSAVALAGKYKNLFVIRSLTKFFAIPGLRLGYSVCTDDKINGLLKTNLSPWNINCFAEHAGIFMLKNPGLFRTTFKKMTGEREYLYSRLCTLPWLKPYKPQANFILVKIPERYNAARLQALLLKQGILIRDASNFTGLDDTFIRVAVKARKANNRLIRALQSL